MRGVPFQRLPPTHHDDLRQGGATWPARGVFLPGTGWSPITGLILAVAVAGVGGVLQMTENKDAA